EALSEKEIYVSSVSACSSKSEPISHVLLSMGLDKGIAANSMRVSFGRDTKEEEVDLFLSTLDSLLKELSPR
ncbi:MAG: cysteine desulfurase, partial [Bacilli bacterium]|nr:cysteine desulfurase [Bacilli bacterium]